MSRSCYPVILLGLLLTGFSPKHERAGPRTGYRDWKVYCGGPDRIRYSALAQINRDNVRQLQAAWTFDTGDAFEGSEMQCNPIIVDGVLYATTPKLRVIALDAARGSLRWSFDPNEGRKVFSKARNRGLTYWEHGKDKRIYFAARHYLYSLDARTGRLRWTFHTIPHPGELGYETWPKDAWKYIGGANNWAGMSLDEKRGLVFVPTGSAAFDFYGANRAGDNLFANSLIALKADTGKRVWHFQAVRHDVWDRDFPAPPNLVAVKRGGRLVDAVAQITKSGHVYVFERETGTALFQIEYRRVPPSEVDGEVLAETQPVPLLPPPFARQVFNEDMVTKRTVQAHDDVLQRLRTLRNGGQFTPPSREGTVIFPGFDGGGEWGGAAFDPETSLLYVNSNEMAWVLRLVERPPAKARPSGQGLYLQYCASCHREDRRGTPPEFPSLIGIGEKYTASEVSRIAVEV